MLAGILKHHVNRQDAEYLCFRGVYILKSFCLLLQSLLGVRGDRGPCYYAFHCQVRGQAFHLKLDAASLTISFSYGACREFTLNLLLETDTVQEAGRIPEYNLLVSLRAGMSFSPKLLYWQNSSLLHQRELSEQGICIQAHQLQYQMGDVQHLQTPNACPTHSLRLLMLSGCCKILGP